VGSLTELQSHSVAASADILRRRSTFNGGIMYLLLLLMFPLLYLFNSYLALAGLAAAIAGMYFQRTQTSRRQAQKPHADSGYKAGYED
jgi:hypothetical protein